MHKFLRFLTDLRQGRAVEQLGESLDVLIARVRETGRKGRLTLHIDVQPASQGQAGDHQLLFTDDILEKPPRPLRTATILFQDDQTGELTRRDPSQPELAGLRSVPDADEKARAAGE